MHRAIVDSLSCEVTVARRFVREIDLLDETMREGAERATIRLSIDDKIDVARSIFAIGIRSIVAGTFPDVPESVELLRRLLAEVKSGTIPADARFLVIAHLAPSLEKTLQLIHGFGEEAARRVWIVALHNVSDIGIRQHLPHAMGTTAANHGEWLERSITERRDQAVAWAEAGLSLAADYRGGGVMLGCMDSFRADLGHLRRVLTLAAARGITQARLVDTAGTTIPEQLDAYVGSLIESFPTISFYGHFHNDFGLATANGIRSLALGMKGIDVSIGGLGNRAGHPPLAEVAAALFYLYGVALPSFDYGKLNTLSRYIERLYGLIEGATRPLTGVVTHGMLTGHRTKLRSEERQLYDVIDPEFVGASFRKFFGIRSAGANGIYQFMLQHRERLEAAGVAVSEENAARLAPLVVTAWNARSEAAGVRLRQAIDAYETALLESSFTEEDMLQLVTTAR